MQRRDLNPTGTLMHPDPLTLLDERIDALCTAARRGALGARPYAALDFDGTCIQGDTGETLHYFLCEHLAYALDGPFWEVIDPLECRAELRAGWERWQPAVAHERARRAAGGWENAVAVEAMWQSVEDPEALRAWIRDLIGVYARRFVRVGQAETYGWAASMHVGLRPEQVAAATRALLTREQARPVATEVWETSDGLPLRLHRGIRSRPRVQAWVRALEDAGIEAWVVSATNQWAVEVAAAQQLGIPSERVIGNRCRVVDGHIIAEREGPVVFREGKCAALRERHGDAPPVVAMGDTWSDAAMLGAATGLAVLVDRGEASLREHATQLGWLQVPSRALNATNGAVAES